MKHGSLTADDINNELKITTTYTKVEAQRPARRQFGTDSRRTRTTGVRSMVTKFAKKEPSHTHAQLKSRTSAVMKFVAEERHEDTYVRVKRVITDLNNQLHVEA